MVDFQPPVVPHPRGSMREIIRITARVAGLKWIRRWTVTLGYWPFRSEDNFHSKNPNAEALLPGARFLFCTSRQSAASTLYEIARLPHGSIEYHLLSARQPDR